MFALDIENSEYILSMYFDSECKPIFEGWNNIGKYRIRDDAPHNPPIGKDHIHVYVKGKELFAMNIDGTSHDGSSGYRLANVVRDNIANEFPEFNIPENGIIESIDESGHYSFKKHYAFSKLDRSRIVAEITALLG